MDVANTGAPATKVIASPDIEIGDNIDRIFDSAVLEVTEQVDTPDEFVALQVEYEFVVPVSVALNVGTIPTTGLLFLFLRVIVIVELAIPSANMLLVPVILEFAATGTVSIKVTLDVTPENPEGTDKESVLSSSKVEEIYPTLTTLESELLP